MSVSVGILKQKLQNALEQLENYDDKQQIHLESNTYFLHNSSTFIGIRGYNGGYLDLNSIDESIEEDYEECED